MSGSMSGTMSESKTDAKESATAAGRPGTATGRPSRADGYRASDGITITRWNLGLSLSIALTVLTGVFTLLWDETTTLRETQVALVTRVSRLEVQVAELREDVTALRVELRESVAGLRGEIRALGDLIRARETPGVGAP